ncbi:MAG: CheR family methyltransferase [Snowella sp.]|nr:CheR family methyltransferase [Snowella sp.]
MATPETNNQEDTFFESLLEYLGNSRGFDFTQFKRNTLKRRILKQMSDRGITNFNDYRDYLEVHPDEFQSLFNTILINVTAFFRDSNAWKYLQEELLPEMLKTKERSKQIRCWSAGCASGEEAYTIAIILAELLGIDEFKKRVKIYATDIDEEALAEARQAQYTAKQIAVIPPELRNKYFEPIDNGEFFFNPNLRRMLVFGRHNLFKDAPISSIDLLVCRNTLMYFNVEAQRLILQRFHFGLNSMGLLFLGKAEMLLTHGDLFIPLNSQYRIFKCVSKNTDKENSPRLFQPYIAEDQVINFHWQLQELAFESALNAQIIIDKDGDLVRTNRLARSLFNLSLTDVGANFYNLGISRYPIELRPLIEQVYQEKKALNIKETPYQVNDANTKYFDIQINPLTQMDENLIGVNITLEDITESWALRNQVEQMNQQLKETNEELKISNIQLQSTNEELETTNEEIQSYNEELETINEELQSTNSELQNVNEEVRLKTESYNQVTDFLEAILLSLRGAIIVIDRELKILAWSAKSEEMWGLRTEEVQDECLFNLDFGLPLEQIREPINHCLNEDQTQQDFVISAVNRRGKTFDCRLSIDALWNINKEKFGVIIIMQEVPSP